MCKAKRKHALIPCIMMLLLHWTVDKSSPNVDHSLKVRVSVDRRTGKYYQMYYLLAMHPAWSGLFYYNSTIKFLSYGPIKNDKILLSKFY